MAVPEQVVAPKAVRDDGSVPFQQPVKGVAGVDPDHLATVAQATGGGPHQPLDATLTAIAALTTAANRLIYATGVDTFATTDLASWVRTNILPAADGAAVRTVLGLGALALLAQVNLATHVTGTLPIANGGTGATTEPGARSALGAAAAGHGHGGAEIVIDDSGFSGSLSGAGITDVQLLANWIDANILP